ncbi:D-glycero-beta-D-manno-heptose 1-phosphate adenylyltransferase [Nanoarchaeota archaeon]
MEYMSKIIDSFSGKKILVIGDIILDKYVFGDVSRLNPEAPVPVLRAKKTEYRLGGAANVAHNIAALGGDCTIVGRVGKDYSKDELIKEFKKTNIKHKLVESKDYPTIKKTRMVAQHQQLVRVDWEETTPLSDAEVKQALTLVIGKYDLIVVSDYGKGMIVPELMKGLKNLGVPIIADMKPENMEMFKGIMALTPNIKEGREMTGKKDPDRIGSKLVKMLNSNIILTRGGDGISLFLKNGKSHYIPTKAKEVYDVSGAGDTVLATLALGVASGLNLYEAVMIANQAAGIVVGKLGTATVTASELKQGFSIQDSKILDRKHMKEIVKSLQKQGKKVVFTNGCFDILHTGHIQLLRQAKSFGDILVLGLNTDASVKRFKGKDRPINNEKDRAEVLAGLESVDYVVFFDEDTPVEIVGELRPDIHVKGGDYNPNDYKNMPEAKTVHDYGGEVKIIKIVDGKSTTNIINKMKGA